MILGRGGTVLESLFQGASLNPSFKNHLLLYLPHMQPVLPLFALLGTTFILVDISSLLQEQLLLQLLLSTILITPFIVFA